MPPNVTGWTRLQPHVRSGGLEGGLRAQLHDPLWMLARQWQLGELAGEDVGSPVQARLRMDATPLTRYLPGSVPASWLQAGTPPATAAAPGQRLNLAVPLETVVERESVRIDGVPLPRQAAEAGLHFLRLLTFTGAAAHRAPVLQRFPLTAPPLDPARPYDADTSRFLEVTVGRVPDGALLSAVFRVAQNPAALAAMPPALQPRVTAAAQVWQTWLTTLTDVDRTRIASAVARFTTWYATLFSEPPSAPSGGAWIPEQVEYAFAAGASLPAAQAVVKTSQSPERYAFTALPATEALVTAAEYTDGHLDWYSFDVLPIGSLGAVRTDLSATDQRREAVRRTVIPTQVRYPGMPSSRYWELEDARVDFGSVAVGVQQLVQLLLIEFAFIYGDDWFVIPVDAPVGSLCRVRWLVVTDTFGERTLVPSAREVDREGGAVRLPWDLFRLAPDARPVPGAPRPIPDVLFLPPSLGMSLNGAPLEDVLLLRDEMANMAWAVERIVESPIGRPLDRSEAFNRARRQGTNEAAATQATGVPTPVSYRLVTDVPDHWLPLFPQRVAQGSPSTLLERGGTPRGRILDPGRGTATTTNTLYLNEEEVPRSGARVTRGFQYTRWIDGSTHLWVGRRKGAGRGEGSSGLRFDVLEPSSQDAP